jgi:hypothetical protein
MQKLNILTRTSNRPIAFKRNAESVQKQTYMNINHIIGTDDKKSFDYIQEHGYEDIVYIDRQSILDNDTCVNPHTGPYSPHNLYMNEIQKSVTDGWIMYLDDDDYLVNETTIEEIMSVVNNSDEDTIIYWQMQYSDGRALPVTMNKKPPRIGGIGSPCFTFHSKYLKFAEWDSWKCSDFRVVHRLHQNIEKYIWIPKVYVKIPSIGLGNRKDG